MTKTFFLSILLVLTVKAADPFEGKWILNIQKSSYPAGTLPKQMVIEMTSLGDGIRYRSETVLASGKTSTTEYTADYNGKQVIVSGSGGMLAPVSLKRIAPNIVEAEYMRGLTVVATSRRSVSNDGKLLTVTTKSKNAAGKSVTNLGVYQKDAM